MSPLLQNIVGKGTHFSLAWTGESLKFLRVWLAELVCVCDYIYYIHICVYISPHMILIHWSFQTLTEEDWNDWSFHFYPPGCIFWIYSYNIIRNKYFWKLHSIRHLCHLFYINFSCSICFRSGKTFSRSDTLGPRKTVCLWNPSNYERWRHGEEVCKLAGERKFPMEEWKGDCLLVKYLRHS